MRARIFWVKDGEEDSMVIEADSLEEMQERAAAEVKRRNADEYWSQEYGEE